jgi:hypothetical protein
VKTQAQRIAYIKATLIRMQNDRNYTRAQAAADIERVWAEDIADNRNEARFEGAVTGLGV